MKIIRNISIFVLGALMLSCSSGSSNSATPCTSPAIGSETPYAAMTSPPMVTMTGCTSIDYQIPTTVGATGSPMYLIVDSGSTTMAVAGSDCDDCAGISPLYAPSASRQYTCFTGEGTEYGDNTYWTGNTFYDSVAVGSIAPVMTTFIDIEDVSTSPAYFNDDDCMGGATTPNTTQGIMGFAGAAIGTPGSVSYLDALNANQSFPPIFAIQMCMVGGNFWLGGYDNTYTTSAPVYTPITSSGSYFNVNLEGMNLTTSLTSGTNLSTNGTIVDTGTSIGVFPQAVSTALIAQLNANAAWTAQFPNVGGVSAATYIFEDGNCLPSASMNETALDGALPPLVLTLQSTVSGTVTVSLPASRSYLDAHMISGQLEYCAGVAPAPGGWDLPYIIGGSMMRSQVVIFDRTNARVGFAPQLTLNTGANSCTN